MKIEAAGAAFSPCGDRFVPTGYREGLEFKRQLGKLSKIKGLKGVPIMYPMDFDDPVKLKATLKEFDLEVATVCPDTYTEACWKDGTLASRDPSIRKKIIRRIKDSMDFCHEVNGADILLWLAHDGYDYPFEDDYRTRWDYITEGLREIASYRDDVKVTIEYKTKEPRTHQYIATVGKSLLLVQEINLPNLGVVLDLGHSLFAGENPAESVALLDRYKRLYHIHLNDNYRGWDDDLLLGSVHFWETIEFFYWLNKINYDGWYTIDIWPTRIDGMKALQESVTRTIGFMNLAKNLPYEEIKKIQEKNATMDLMELLRSVCLK
ncbi:MAG: sugar phosphate isomerase/epimerase family protein [Mahellales bacterium]